MSLLVRKITALFLLLLLLLCNGMQYFAAPWFAQQLNDDVVSVLAQPIQLVTDVSKHHSHNKLTIPVDLALTDAEDKSQFSLTPSRLGYCFELIPQSTLLPLPNEQVMSQVAIEPLYRPPKHIS